MTGFPSSPVTATDEMVERAWAAIVGSDIAAQCYQASIIRADLKTALEAVLGHAQRPLTAEDVYANCETTLIGFRDELTERDIKFICDQVSRKVILALSSTLLKSKEDGT